MAQDSGGGVETNQQKPANADSALVEGGERLEQESLLELLDMDFYSYCNLIRSRINHSDHYSLRHPQAKQRYRNCKDHYRQDRAEFFCRGGFFKPNLKLVLRRVPFSTYFNNEEKWGELLQSLPQLIREEQTPFTILVFVNLPQQRTFPLLRERVSRAFSNSSVVYLVRLAEATVNYNQAHKLAQINAGLLRPQTEGE